MIDRGLPPSAFIAAAKANRPVVVELGIYAYPQAFDFLHACQAAGANLWWFDGDRDEAFKAWLKDAALRRMPPQKWDEVVSVIRQNWRLVEDFFRDRIVRTIEAGPVHVPPAETHRAIFGVQETKPEAIRFYGFFEFCDPAVIPRRLDGGVRVARSPDSYSETGRGEGTLFELRS